MKESHNYGQDQGFVSLDFHDFYTGTHYFDVLLDRFCRGELMSNLTIMVALLILIIFALVITAGIAWSLAKKFSEMEARIKQLENAQPKRMPYKAVNGIEDAIAVIIDADRMTDEAISVIHAQQQRINKARGILGTVRADPYQYDDKAPAGPRPAWKGVKMD